jgi:peptidoglycan hydrolase-like protein with peptidoglycan-binding domain
MNLKQKNLFIFICLVLSFALYSDAQAAEIFFSNLKLGSTGVEVKELQKVLNSDPSTRIATSGAGAPGQETDYFGAKTHVAVVKFQEIYRNEVLTPAGLTKGSGFVGQKTREKLNSIYTAMHTKSAPIVTTSPVKPAPAKAITKPENPNYENLDEFIATVIEVNRKKGKSEEELNKIAAQIRKDAATTTDLRALFDKQVRASQGKPSTVSAIGQKLSKMLPESLRIKISMIAKALLPAKVYAKTGLAYGGTVGFTYLCTCSDTWLVTVIGPMGGLFDYTIGTQIYSYYNLPYARYVLGVYVPPTAPICVSEPETECAVVIETQGVITATTGTSSQ